MEFLDKHKTFFNAKYGSFSDVTFREFDDSQITLDKSEKELFINYLGQENVLVGKKLLDPSKAQKHFLLYPELNEIALNLVYPKENKPELRLYLSSENGFKPNGEDIWFAYINHDNKIVIGYMSRIDWEKNGLGESLNFKPRARLLLQLGDQLIKSETIALSELVKNSYDADASYCLINMQNINQVENAEITILDDGCGMDIETIKNIWLEPGSDNKQKLVREKIYSEKGRLPIGEKGIGRFGVHKLGKQIELISRKKDCKEVVVEIDWEKFEDHKYLEDAPVIAFERKAKFFKGEETGTHISIKRINESWTRGKLREAFRAINSVSVPSSYDIDKNTNAILTNNTSFRAEISTNLPEWIYDIPRWDDIIQFSLFYFDVEIFNNHIIKFDYKFRPWETMDKISERIVTITDNPISGLLEVENVSNKKFEAIKISPDMKIGTIKFQGCIFIRDKSILKLSLNSPTFLTEYLNENGGVRVYRDGLRIYDYGEKGNDWLGLDYRRFNDPGVKISNNLILASITLDRKSSSSLIEKTNREGFIENEAFEIFRNQVLFALRLIEICREPDKKRLDSIYKPKIETESVLNSINNLRNYVNNENLVDKTKNDLNFYINKVESNYKFMYDKLVKSASAGMGWGIYIHEIEKIIKEIEKVIKLKDQDERAVKLINHLSKLIDGYAQILKKSDRTSEYLKTIIKQSLFNVEFRFKAHKINIIDAFSEVDDVKVKISKNLIVSTLMNIFDNSIYWLDRSGTDCKKIRLAISNEKEGYVSVVVSDNGTGFLLSPEQMVEPLVSAKGGMGMGLHLANEIMQGHTGILSFNEFEEFSIPEEFKIGATLALCFKI